MSNSDDGPNAPNPNASTGKVLLIVGLAALVGLIFFFLATTIYVQTRPQFQLPGAPAAATIFVGIYATIGLLLIRNIFRVIEFSQGFYGDIAVHEVYFYVFDSIMMVLWICLMVPLHFG